MKTALITTALMAAIPFAVPGQKSQEGGEAIFQEQCAGCHGPDGHGQTEMGKKVQAADLTSSAVQQMSDSKLEKTVKDGNGKMPSFNGKLSDEEIRSVLGYVRQFGKH